MERGWVKLYRKITEWEWFTDPATAHLFIYLIAKANRKPTRYKGVEIPAGGLTTSQDALCKATGLTRQQIRTALNHLISTNDVTKRSTKKYTLLIVNNWDSYQTDNQEINQQLTISQPTTNQQLTTNKNERSKEVEKENITLVEISSKTPVKTAASFPETIEVISYWNATYGRRYRSDTKQTNDQVRKLLESGYSVEDIKMVIDFKAGEVRRNPKSEKWFNPTSVFRPENFQRAFEWASNAKEKRKEKSVYDGHRC